MISKEIIYKLISSNNQDDILLGFHFWNGEPDDCIDAIIFCSSISKYKSLIEYNYSKPKRNLESYVLKYLPDFHSRFAGTGKVSYLTGFSVRKIVYLQNE